MQCFFRTNVCVFLVLLLQTVWPSTAHGADKPNIVIIMADDLGAETLGCYGGTSYRTPHLDALARSGIRFEDCHATPACSTSRAELLTGRYVFRNGMKRVILPRDDVNTRLDVQTHRTFANFLRDAGYSTCIAGKWHLCHDFLNTPNHVADAGFESRFLWRLFKDREVSRHYWNPPLWLDGRPDDETGKGKFGDDLFTDHVLKFIRDHKDGPFLVYYPMTLIHSQTATGGNFPRSPLTLRPGDNPDEEGPAGFGELVSYMDLLVGRIVTELDQLGLGQNTLVLFTGDNGTDAKITSQWQGRAVKGGKGTISEAATRVPLIVRWTGVAPPGKVADDLVDFTDFLPTLLEAAGVTLPPDYPIDGRSFLPQLRGQQGQPRDWVYRQYAENWLVRDHRYSLDSKGVFLDLSQRYSAVPADASPEAMAAKKRLQAASEEVRGKTRLPERTP